MRGYLRDVCSLVLAVVSLVVPKRKRMILLGASLGKSFNDSTAELFLHLINECGDDFEAIWMTKNASVAKEVEAYGGRVCRIHSFRGIWYSLRASVVVTTHSIRDVILYYPFMNRPKEIHFLHGVPGMRKNFMTSKAASKRVVRQFRRHARCMTLNLTTSRWAAGIIEQDYHLESDRVKITGLPRNDILFLPSNRFSMEEKKVIERLNPTNFVLLYAPAWRRREPARFFPFEKEENSMIFGYLREKAITVILRPHVVDLGKRMPAQLEYMLERYGDVLRLVGPDIVANVQHLLRLSNCLITDYSSIHYDFLLLDRPMLFIPYDYDEYVEEMGGLNCDYDQFTAGPKIGNGHKFLKVLSEIVEGRDGYAVDRRRVRDMVHYYQDGFSSARVCKVLSGLCA